MYNRNSRRPRGRFFLFPLVFLAFVLVLGGVVMWLWNAVLSPVLAVRPLTYGQGIGLLILCRILFGNFRRGGPPPSFRRNRPWQTKWMHMSDEDRAKFREEWKNRCRKPDA